MLETAVLEELHKKLIEFAKKHPRIRAIFKGTSPEGCGENNYHFLAGSKYKLNDKLDDEVTELDIDLANNFLPEAENISIDVWPIDPKDANEYFLGEFIYKK